MSVVNQSLSPRSFRAQARRVSGGLSAAWLLLLIFVLWEAYARVIPSIHFPPISEILDNFGTVALH